MGGGGGGGGENNVQCGKEDTSEWGGNVERRTQVRGGGNVERRTQVGGGAMWKGGHK